MSLLASELETLRQQVAPSGVLRAALNHGNRILVSCDTEGAARGITVDLARLLAERLQLPLTFEHYERAVDVANAAGTGSYDLCFLAVDPLRAEVLDFTAPYVAIEGAYLAGPDCAAQDAAELVMNGEPVGTVDGSAYTLHLSRQPGADHLRVFSDIDAAIAALSGGAVSAVAGIGAVMQAEAEKLPGARVLSPPFMTIRQAMAVPRTHPGARAYVEGFLEELLLSGELGGILERHGVPAECAVVPDGHGG